MAYWTGDPWRVKCYNLCAAPGGVRRAAYATLCCFCAAGDVARHTGRSPCLDGAGGVACMSFWPVVCAGHPASFGVGLCCTGACWATTRDAVRDRYGIEDTASFAEDVVRLTACAPCHIAQELNECEARESLRKRLYRQGIPSQFSMDSSAPPTGADVAYISSSEEEEDEEEEEEEEEEEDPQPVPPRGRSPSPIRTRRSAAKSQPVRRAAARGRSRTPTRRRR